MIHSIIIIEANSIHEIYTEFLNKEIQQSILSSTYNPFRSRSLNSINILEDKKDLESGVIIIPSYFLQFINSSKYLKKITEDPGNMIIFISNQINDTVGKRIMDRERNIVIGNNQYEIKCRVDVLQTFNSHSDFNQLNAYISRLKPKLRKIIVNHGERSKVQNFASYSSKTHNVATQYQLNQEAVKIL